MYGKDRSGIGRAALVTPSGQLMGMPNLMDAALNDRLFHCNTATVVDCSTTLNTTFTGLGVCNPGTSGKYYIFY